MKKINAILTISRRALKRNPMIPPVSRSIAIIPVGMIPLSVSISIPITSRPPASWIAFLRKAWQEKIPERSEDDFFLSSQALEGSLVAKGWQSKTFAA